MSDFKGCHFEGGIVLWAVRWYGRYGVSYRDPEQMMGERGVLVDHSTIFRWVQKYAPEIEKRLRPEQAQKLMEDLQKKAKVELNPAFFGSDTPAPPAPAATVPPAK